MTANSRLVTPLFALLAIAPWATAQSSQQTPDLYMLSVGVDKYQPPTNSLQGCVADAVGMAKVFQGQAGKQFGQVEAKLLTDYAATQAAITSQLKALEAKGRPGDWYVILLSGHGGIVRNQWGFLTHDNRNLFDDVLLGAADRLAADGKKVLVIIDACNAGQLRHAAAGILGRHTDPDKGGIILMVSSMPDQLSTALGTYSAFARAVEEGLQGMADHDGDELITLKELRRFTHTRVYELRLKRRVFPGVTPSWQESAIDASFSIPENLALVRAKKPAPPPAIDDGPEVKSAELPERTWKITIPATPKSPPVNYELKLDPFGHYVAVLKQGLLPASMSAGAYRVKAKAVHLAHPQGVDRLEIVSITPTEFQFKFEGRVLKAVAEPLRPEMLLADVTGRLSPEDPRDRVRKDSPHKVHKVKLEAGTPYVIDLQSPEFDAFLRLEDEAGVQVAEDDDGGGGRNARIQYAPPKSGEYRVIVTSFAPGAVGIYHLHVEKRTGPRPPDQPPAGVVVFNVSETLSAGDPKDRVRPESYARTYNVPLKAGVAYQIDLVSPDFDTYLRLEDEGGAQLAFNDDGGEGYNSRLTFTAPRAATYRMVVTSYATATGRFTLTVRASGTSPVTGPPAGNGGQPLTLTGGKATVSDQLTASDGMDSVRRASHRKVFLLKTDAKANYTVLLKSQAFDAYLRVEDPLGRQIAYDDDSGGGRDARITLVTPVPGVYRVIVTTFHAQATGAFTLLVEESPP